MASRLVHVLDRAPRILYPGPSGGVRLTPLGPMTPGSGLLRELRTPSLPAKSAAEHICSGELGMKIDLPLVGFTAERNRVASVLRNRKSLLFLGERGSEKTKVIESPSRMLPRGQCMSPYRIIFTRS